MNNHPGDNPQAICSTCGEYEWDCDCRQKLKECKELNKSLRSQLESCRVALNEVKEKVDANKTSGGAIARAALFSIDLTVTDALKLLEGK